MRWLLLSLILVSHLSLASLECEWPYKTAITVQENSGSSLTNYQVLLRINGSQLHPNYDWSNAGDDLRILDQDDNSAIPFYIDNWNASSQIAEVWIKLTNLPANSSRTLYLYYGKSDADPLAQVPPVFDKRGIRFHTRYSATNPGNKEQAFAAFDASNDSNGGYGCKFITDFTNVTNHDSFPSGSSRNIIAYSQSYFEVKPGEYGRWYFRYGADFGRGGGIYIDGEPLEEDWNSDLWWEGNWNHRDVLTGSKTLTEGYHKIEIIGSEGGNDGGITAQFCKPGGRCDDTREWRQQWQAFATRNIDIRSYSCPIAEPTIRFGSSSSCASDLQLNYSAPELWVIGSARTLTLSARNNGPDSAKANSNIQLTLPTSLVLDSSQGAGWNCTGTSTLSCSYNQTVAANASYPDLNLNIRAISGSSATINAVINTHNQYDTDRNNNTQTIITDIRQLILPSGLTAGCGQNSGLLTGFFDTRSNPDSDGWANSFAEMNTLEQNFATASYLYGYTRLPNVDGNNNPFGNDEGYLTLFDGFIYLQQDGNYRFAVDGDDAVELTLFDHQGTAHRASWYGGHAASNGPSGTILADGFARGYYRFRFRHQENVGGDVYTAFWQQPAASSYQIIPASQFSNCQGGQSVTLSSSSSVISDPINSNNFKAIPGAVIEYRVVARNNGVISTDLNSTSLQQTIDDGSEFKVGSLTLSDGTGNSASGLDITTANIEYLDGSGAVIIPNGEFDPAVRAFRLSFDGTFRPEFDSLTPEFSYQYQIRLQ